MLEFLMQRDTGRGSRFYRVALYENLFGEYSVLREWGRSSTRGAERLAWFSNLRDACAAVDRWQRRAQSRGYSAAATKGLTR